MVDGSNPKTTVLDMLPVAVVVTPPDWDYSYNDFNNYAMCNFLRKNNGLVVEGLKMLFSKLPKYRWLEKVAHGVQFTQMM